MVTGYDVSVGLLPGHTLSGLMVSGSGTNVGNYPVTFTGTALIKDGLVDVTQNYNVSLLPGNLEITKAKLAVSVTANSGSKIYTGSAQMVTGHKVPVGLLPGHVLSGLTASGSGTNVGNYPVTFGGTALIMDGLVDVTENYNISLEPGNLEITKTNLAVSVTANSDSKIYTGSAQMVIGHKVPVGLLPGHVLSGLTASGYGTNVGNYPITFGGIAVIMDGAVDVTENYNISLEPGNLEITKAALGIIVTANSDSKVYTGSAQMVTGYDVSVGLLPGHVLSGLTASGSGINVGNYPVTFSGTALIMDGLVDVTQNYNISLEPGNLEITKANLAVSVTANSDSKIYTGSAQTVTGYEVPVGLLPGHTLSGLMASASGTNIGNYPVIFGGIALIMDGLVDVTQNYNVSLVPGNLFIWKSELTVNKSADRETFLAVGEEINYTYRVENTGNVTLSGPFTLVDDKIGIIETDAGSLLAPGAVFEGVGVYVVTQADMDAGFVTNLVKATGEFGEDGVIGEDEVTVPANPPTPTDPDPTNPDPTDPDPTDSDPTDPTPPSEEVVEIEEEDIPLGNGDLEEEGTELVIEEEIVDESIIDELIVIDDDLIPQGQAGVFYGFGTLLVALGFVFKKKKRSN